VALALQMVGAFVRKKALLGFALDHALKAVEKQGIRVMEEPRLLSRVDRVADPSAQYGTISRCLLLPRYP
jgi:hypothetical protein